MPEIYWLDTKIPYRQNIERPRVPILTEENRYQLLKLLEQNPSLNQRELAKAMGISLGKTNYCLNALIEKGLIKVANFKRSNTKMNYAYYLTPKGLDEKARVTMQFLKRKKEEYELLVRELEELQREAAQIEIAHDEDDTQ